MEEVAKKYLMRCVAEGETNVQAAIVCPSHWASLLPSCRHARIAPSLQTIGLVWSTPLEKHSVRPIAGVWIDGAKSRQLRQFPGAQGVDGERNWRLGGEGSGVEDNNASESRRLY
jgi:hypothetical protein